MSRLDSFIRRLSAQRDCLGYVKELIKSISGPILELGLGNGRTYDHLRSLFPDREIYAFDRKIAAHLDCIPGNQHMIVGDFYDTLPGILKITGEPVALVHADVITRYKDIDAEMNVFLSKTLPGLMAPGGLIVSDHELMNDHWTRLPLPEGVPENRYYINRAD